MSILRETSPTGNVFIFNSLMHCRTPRVDLSMNVTPSFLGDLLCKYMHDEDNKHGLHVTNVRGDKWKSYGDGMLKKSDVIIDNTLILTVFDSLYS